MGINHFVSNKGKWSICQTRSFQNCPETDVWKKGRKLFPVSQQIYRIGYAGSASACVGLRDKFLPNTQSMIRYHVLVINSFFFFFFQPSVANVYM